jgi:hypothetical protein
MICKELLTGYLLQIKWKNLGKKIIFHLNSFCGKIMTQSIQWGIYSMQWFYLFIFYSKLKMNRAWISFLKDVYMKQTCLVVILIQMELLLEE